MYVKNTAVVNIKCVTLWKYVMLNLHTKFERLKRDLGGMKKYVENINTQRKKSSDAGKRKMTSREMRKLEFARAKNPLASSKPCSSKLEIYCAC